MSEIFKLIKKEILDLKRLHVKMLSDNKTFAILMGVFLISLVVRSLYFPNNIPFGYDQARDAFISRGLLYGDLKILGPPSTLGVHHGALSYYVFSPFYIITENPQLAAGFLRLYNAIGVFLIFFITKILFRSSRSALIASLIYAVSFEQSQYSIFLGHPSLAILSVLMFYLGILWFVEEKKKIGLPIAFIAAGISMQFHFSLIILLPILVAVLLINKNKIPKLSARLIIWSVVGFIISILTYVLSEIKFGFSNSRFIINKFINGGNDTDSINPENLILVLERYVNDNLVFAYSLFVFGVVFVLYTKLEKQKHKLLFLTLWLFGGLIIYLFDSTGQPTYYYGIGASCALIIMSSKVMDKLASHSKLLSILFLVLIISSNLFLIQRHNEKGTIPEINAQNSMLLSDQLKVLDHIYEEASGSEFSVYALTIPYKVNTLWSYIFGWYGLERYNYLPIWGGEAAPGYEGEWEGVRAQSELPDLRFAIVEPTRGLPDHLIKDFLSEEDLFWTVEQVTKIGDFTVYKQTKRN